MPKVFSYSNSGEESAAHTYIEISIDPYLLNNYPNESGFAAFLAANGFSEEFRGLKRELLKEIMIIVETRLTEKQREVIKMTYVDGKTQNEISEELGKHQTTVHKILQGNIDYNNQKKRYGGAIKKLRKLCLKNGKIQEILTKMRACAQETAAEDG